ncbi:MAG: hypothetical protein JST90_01290 [Bacteroidetes bacterium]|nr:hypothetical protein [Bacteroidota bacterium]
MHKISTTVLSLILILALASCSKSPAPSTSFVSVKYLGIDHLYTCKGLEQDSTYVINADESGSVNKVQIRLTHVAKGSYAMGPATDAQMIWWVDGAAYSTRSHGSTGNVAINIIDSTIYNIHGNLTGHLYNVQDTTDYLDVGGEFNVKYQY